MTEYEAIYNRCSVRKYRMERIPADFFRQLTRFLEGLEPLYPDVPWQFVMFSAMDKEGDTRGLFKTKAPYYLVCYTGESKDAYRQAGYLTEQVVLYLASHGIGTCYQGGAKAVLDEEPEGMKQRIVVAFGYAEERLYREASSAKRQSVKELCIFKEEASAEEEMLLAAAILAPSAMNGQPWRFVVYKNRIHIFSHERALSKMHLTGQMQEIDMGIVLYHLALAAEELWLDAHLVYNAQLAERSVKGNRYVMSMMLQE